MSFSTSLISPLSIAPMIDWTYTHFRVFMRFISPKALLYTEMLTPLAIINNAKQTLAHSPIEYPLALQLGGSDINTLVESAKIAEAQGFSEINLNLGCPSDRVQAGRFGACLMAEGDFVARCITALKSAVTIPVSAKTRIGIDSNDSYVFFQSFAQKLIEAGSDKLIVHARKAWLKGLSPKQNRTIPELRYDYVYRIKEEFPSLPVIINGNIQTNLDIKTHMDYVDGVMLGRLVCQNPYALEEINRLFFPSDSIKTRSVLIEAYFEYILPFLKIAPLSILLKPIINIAHGLPDAKLWKEQLLKASREKNSCYLKDALQFLQDIEKEKN